jgi:ABC-2 type transport system ATP-binding protein
MQVIKVENVSKIFEGKKYALKNVDISIPENALTLFVGPNGSGKTTLLEIIIGFLEPTRGTVTLPTKRIGVSFQEPIFFPKLTVKENLKLMAKLMGNYDKRSIKYLKENLFLLRWDNFLAENLSSGVSKRLDLALALSHDPDIIILDEPLSTLDASSKRRFVEFLKELKHTKTVIIATHDLDFFGELEVIDNIGVLLKEMKYFGRPPSLGDEYTLTIEDREGKKIEVEIANLEETLRNIDYKKIKKGAIKKRELSGWVQQILDR